MSITKSKSYTTTDGAVHATLELAQRAELTKLLACADGPGGPTAEDHAAMIAAEMIAHRDEFIAVLCASGRKPRTKKAKRGKKVEVSE